MAKIVNNKQVIKLMKAQAVGILNHASISVLGSNSDAIKHNLTSENNIFSAREDLVFNKTVWVGEANKTLVDVPIEFTNSDSRNLQLAFTALADLADDIQRISQKYPKQRLGVIIGSSTSGIADNEPHIKTSVMTGKMPTDFHYARQEMSVTAKILHQYLNWKGPCYGISTACSSSGKAIAIGQRLIQADLCDAVLVGGVDSLCKLTLNGFNSLESLAQYRCSPFGSKRDGINIGEAAGLFLLTKEEADIMLYSSGESSDAWHISAPHPEGKGAATAMTRALQAAQLSATDIDYLNLHGTGTPQNDAMETLAVREVFKQNPILVSSTKHRTGHCLGAAGAIEAAIACTILASNTPWLPWHNTNEIEPQLADLNYVQPQHVFNKPIKKIMSNSFAFGGSNVSLIIGRNE